MKFHYTYIIYCNEPTSSLYGCIYYGKHSTGNLLDGYITSGKIIKKYIKKYPNGYYRKILSLYNSVDELNKAEYNLIHNHLNKPYCLNLIEGGTGSGNFANIYKANPDFNKGKNNSMYGKNPRDYMSPERVIEMDKRRSEMMSGSNNPMYGKGDKISGEKNGMYGKSLKDYMTEEAYNKWLESHHRPCNENAKKIFSERNKRSRWMTNGIHRVFPTEDKFQKYLDMGYHFGRR